MRAALLLLAAAYAGAAASESKPRRAASLLQKVLKRRTHVRKRGEDVDEVDGEPVEAGCYVRLPSGCRNRPWKKHSWRHDAGAEDRGADERGCLARKDWWNKFCGVSDAEPRYLASASDAAVAPPPTLLAQAAEPTMALAEDNDAPDAPAPVQLSRTAERVVTGEAEHSDEGEGEHMVMQVYDPTDPDVIQGEPTEPGCYYRSPTGCWQHPRKNNRWRHDVQMENHPMLNEVHCLGRKVWWDEYCGTIDAKIQYVPGGERVAQEKQAASEAPKEESPSGGAPEGSEVLGEEWKAPLQAMGTDPDEVQGHPSEPGCYIRMPGGCTLHAFRSDNWRHDVAAEDEYVDEASCLARHGFWNSYCGSSDAELLFLGDPVMSEAVAKPNILSAVGIKEGEAGDLLLLQKPAPPVDGLQLLQLGAVASESPEWPWGEKLKKRKQKANEANLARGAVVESYPSQPGCYMRMPSGCPRRPMQTQLWRHDTWAEKQEVNETGCHERKQVWDRYCGTTDASIVWVTLSFSGAAPASTSPRPVAALQLAAAPEWPWNWNKHKEQKDESQPARADAVAETMPSEPGCYMKMPSGCPRRPMQTSLWRHDTWAENHNFTESQCGQRKAVWDKYCGADDAKVVFVTSGSS